MARKPPCPVSPVHSAGATPTRKISSASFTTSTETSGTTCWCWAFPAQSRRGTKIRKANRATGGGTSRWPSPITSRRTSLTSPATASRRLSATRKATSFTPSRIGITRISRGRFTASRPRAVGSGSRTVWAWGMSTATAAATSWRKTDGGSNRRRLRAIRNGRFTRSRFRPAAARKCTPTTWTATATTT